MLQKIADDHKSHEDDLFENRIKVFSERLPKSGLDLEATLTLTFLACCWDTKKPFKVLQDLDEELAKLLPGRCSCSRNLKNSEAIADLEQYSRGIKVAMDKMRNHNEALEALVDQMDSGDFRRSRSSTHVRNLLDAVSPPSPESQSQEFREISFDEALFSEDVFNVSPSQAETFRPSLDVEDNVNIEEEQKPEESLNAVAVTGAIVQEGKPSNRKRARADDALQAPQAKAPARAADAAQADGEENLPVPDNYVKIPSRDLEVDSEYMVANLTNKKKRGYVLMVYKGRSTNSRHEFQLLETLKSRMLRLSEISICKKVSY
ncbi:hypothetical protein L596_030688 [Steinernema carpocapsae]|uniref:Uncharacterized protein n=1 Tax=Steinernema carpocapsae TaxID=34508 RepID=A0A4U5LQ22_STECR|nr:hypothetical protein L596_030681 [Steinernema carpocapsae]TKR58065.1 hypothetical protein L596_030688 [Steinernema carpocapsae]